MTNILLHFRPGWSEILGRNFTIKGLGDKTLTLTYCRMSTVKNIFESLKYIYILKVEISIAIELFVKYWMSLNLYIIHLSSYIDCYNAVVDSKYFHSLNYSLLLHAIGNNKGNKSQVFLYFCWSFLYKCLSTKDIL